MSVAVNPEVVVDSDVAAVFNNALRSLEADGWRSKADVEGPWGRIKRNIADAIEWVVPWDGTTPYRALYALCLRLDLVSSDLRDRRSSYDNLYGALIVWNYAPERTFEDLRAALTVSP